MYLPNRERTTRALRTGLNIRFVTAVAVAACLCVSCAKKPPEPLVSPGELGPPVATDAELAQNADALVQQAKRHRHTYKIGPDDVLRLVVWQREDLSKEGAVRDDGTFYVALAGNVPVADLSVAEAQDAVRQALAKYLRDPQVDLEVKEYRSQKFFASGQFRNPGAYPVKGTTTLLEAIHDAGGVTENGNLGGAYLVRGGQVVPIDFVGMFTRGQTGQNIPLADGDMVYVPSIQATRVFVLGEVIRPSGVPIRSGRITLAQAIADAGGFNEVTAYKRGIKIIRGGIGSANVIEVNYDDVLKGKRVDLTILEPGDIVYVPASGLAKWDRVLGQILPNLSRIVVDAAAIDAMNR